MNTKDFSYYLPEELIAQTPLENREKSKMMLLDKNTGEIKHKIFEDVLEYINKGDTIVLNDTKVLPARIFGNRINKDEKIEFLLLKEIDKDTWQTLVKPGKKAKLGEDIIFGNGVLKATVIDILEDGQRVIKFTYEGVFNEILDKIGMMPLPPYITKKLEDKDRYQTVYSKNLGSAAAPTAGLHFTGDILNKLKEKGVNIVYVTLHVGIGTFRPVKVDNILDHKMHSEYFVIDKQACDILNETKKRKNKVYAVGTTSCRVLESASSEEGIINPMSKETDIFIYPGYTFKMIDGLITNFHLPESTLLMLVSAFATKENILKAYKGAVENKYRFFSFGDCMFIK
jgi:S-adenosylmethionine:tRNA ribosyltransferase-isomerase